jgi:predicted RNase H-like HicB family nuclease
MSPIEFDVIVFQEGKTYVAYCPELDLSSCGQDVENAKRNLRTAVGLFIQEAQKLGTLEDILKEGGYQRDSSGGWRSPRILATERMSVASPA